MADKYIKRDAVLDYLTIMPIDIGFSDIDRVIDFVKDFPAADVEPVRHGRWDYDSDGVPCCTVCGEPALQRLYLYFKNKSFSAPFEKSKFCPNCGAKMDKEDNDA